MLLLSTGLTCGTFCSNDWMLMSGTRMTVPVTCAGSSAAMSFSMAVSESGKIARVDNELGGAAQPLERLVHLFATDDGNVPVNVAAHETRGRGDVVHAVVGRDFFPHGFVFPGTAQLGVIVPNVLVVAVAAGHKGYAGAGDGGFETRGLRDDEVGGHAA